MELPTPPSSGRCTNSCLRQPPSKPSLPIAIPAHRKSTPGPIRSPGIQSSSPDLIFDMSPVSFSDSPLSNHHYPSSGLCMPPLHGRLGFCLSLPRQETITPHEPFMYPFPTIPNCTGMDTTSKRLREPVTATSVVLVPVQPEASAESHSCLPAALEQNDPNFKPSPESDTLECASVGLRYNIYPSYGRAPFPCKKSRHRPSFQNSRSDAIHFVRLPDEYVSSNDLDNIPSELEKCTIHYTDDGNR